MQATVLEERSSRQVVFLVLTAVFSVGLHVGAAFAISRIEIPEEAAPVWVQAIIHEIKPEPVPEPVPEPEPEPEPKPEPKPVQVPKPEVVKFEETTPDPTPATAPAPVRRINFGTTVQSTGQGAGWSAPTGNTVATRQRNDGPADDSPYVTVPYTSVTESPRIKGGAPRLTIPQELIDAEIQGRVEVELTIGGDGAVMAVEIVSKLHPVADAACVADLKKTRWTPGSRDGVAVVVVGVPYSCRYEMAVE